jgi:hypothetical protein
MVFIFFENNLGMVPCSPSLHTELGVVPIVNLLTGKSGCKRVAVSAMPFVDHFGVTVKKLENCWMIKLVKIS